MGDRFAAVDPGEAWLSYGGECCLKHTGKSPKEARLDHMPQIIVESLKQQVTDACNEFFQSAANVCSDSILAEIAKTFESGRKDILSDLQPAHLRVQAHGRIRSQDRCEDHQIAPVEAGWKNNHPFLGRRFAVTRVFHRFMGNKQRRTQYVVLQNKAFLRWTA